MIIGSCDIPIFLCSLLRRTDLPRLGRPHGPHRRRVRPPHPFRPPKGTSATITIIFRCLIYPESRHVTYPMQCVLKSHLAFPSFNSNKLDLFILHRERSASVSPRTPGPSRRSSSPPTAPTWPPAARTGGSSSGPPRGATPTVWRSD